MGSQIEPIQSDPGEVVALRFPLRPRRDRLIAAIAHVVAQDGYRAASVSKIVAVAGVSRNSFYEHFANKEECFLAAYDEAVEQVMARVRSATSTARSRRDALEAGFGAFLGYAADEPELAWLCIVEVLAAGPRALARRDEAMRRFAAFLEEGRGDDPSDVPPVLTEVIVGGVYEVIYARILNRETATLPELLPDVLYVWLAPFVGAARATAVRSAAAGRLSLADASGGSVIALNPESRRTGGT
ncbi:TetR/AcrR family transcriptional regulator [Conexibacter sp. JD483]|uniref:TetR/AcrR family transcriptional regulator n=1 Tax=unclassified Conexibacter TaxID=2627773 RepID=UPI002723BEF7|nr:MULTISPECIES: TetR/AcrR family transcriptional regulator [unclassified Conexibacter]MDO8185118.1 TetR/AcrR family transcriptional regulator [Conexibacter sp. CPCC 205706]MDO8196828.1 TetR/AcrR family transcriptional regulator [Conexibacter sp. CPCC 205762]MDR9368604.1 TetR/AcrR family transcriptional regulator [Conexibacter sp. JD483]